MRWLLLTGLLLVTAACGPAPGETADEDIDGGPLYLEHCERCHGYDGRGTDAGADLRWRAGSMTADEIADVIVLGEGLMKPLDLSDEEASAVADFVLENLVFE